MAEIQSISPAEFNNYQSAKTTEQNKNTDLDTINNLPPVYNPSEEQTKEPSGIGAKGATLLGLSMLAIGGFVGHNIGGKNMKSAKEALEKELTEQKQKVADATKLYEETKRIVDKLQSELDDLKTKIASKKPSWYINLINKIKSVLNKYKK